MVKKPPKRSGIIVNRSFRVIFSTSSVIFYSYLCVVSNAGVQLTTEANFKLEYEDILHFLPHVKTMAWGFLFIV